MKTIILCTLLATGGLFLTKKLNAETRGDLHKKEVLILVLCKDNVCQAAYGIPGKEPKTVSVSKSDLVKLLEGSKWIDGYY